MLEITIILLRYLKNVMIIADLLRISRSFAVITGKYLQFLAVKRIFPRLYSCFVAAPGGQMSILIPKWATLDASARLDFYIQTLALHHSREGTTLKLIEAANLSHGSITSAIRKGYCTRRTAIRLHSVVPDAGISAMDLMDPIR